MRWKKAFVIAVLSLLTLSHAAVLASSAGPLGNWSVVSAMSVARQYHRAVTVNGYLYVLGGTLGSPQGGDGQSTVEGAKVNPDGTLGSWQALSQMTTARYSLAAVAANGYLYAIGGNNSQGSFLSSVERAKVNPDGTLGSWQLTTPMNRTRQDHAAVVAQGFIYVLGGVTPTDSPIVERAAINPDGSLGVWQDLASQMTTTRGGVGAAAVNSYLYAIGGGAASILSSVERAKVNPDGTLGSWQLTMPMTSPRIGHAVVEAHGHLFAIGGSNQSGTALKSVEFTPAQADGSLLPWQLTSPMTMDRRLLAAAASGDYLYALGGENNTPAPQSSVERAAIMIDSIAPTTVASAGAYAFGTWTNSNVIVSLSATDNPGGSGVKEITYSASGAQTITSTTDLPVPTITAEGITTLTFYATDNAGNLESVQSVTIKIDRTAPSVSCSASPSSLWPPNHKMVNTSVSVTVLDGLSGEGEFRLVSVMSNEPDNGLGDGDTAGDIDGWAIGTSETSGQLRAERSATGNGRVYTLHYEARDGAGNIATTQCTVSVPVSRN